jgi:hypothetical protein
VTICLKPVQDPENALDANFVELLNICIITEADAIGIFLFAHEKIASPCANSAGWVTVVQ